MNKPLKRLTLALWLMAVVAMVLMVAMQLSTRDRAAAQFDNTPVLAPDFTLTDQLGRSVSTADLKGHPWIADFIFTECASACPLMSHRLSDLQAEIPASVKFVSFSVDPQRDTPPVLLAYAKQYGADNDRWRFLTGDKDKVFTAISGMKVSVIPATAGNPIEHDIHYLLIDSSGHLFSSGQLHGVYDSRYPDQVDQLIKDASALASEPVQ
jgi:protein SCO1/2